MSLLLITGLCGMLVAERGVADVSLIVVTMTGLALACGGASALNHVLDRDIDKLMGTRTRARPLAAERMPPSRALEFGLTLALDAAEHRDRRRRGGRPAARRLRGGHGESDAAGALALPDRLPLDSTALLGACPVDSARLRSGADSDAARCPRRTRNDPADRPVRGGARGGHRVSGRLGSARLRVSRSGAPPRRRIPLARACPAPRNDTAPSGTALPLPPPLPRAALRRDGGRPPAVMTEPTADPAPSTTVAPVEPVGEVARKNIVLALALVGVVLLIVAGTIAVSFIYLHYD